MDKIKNQIRIFGIIYLVIFGIMTLAGLFCGSKIVEFTGFMFLASTFLPFPADTYILYSSKFFTPAFIGVVGGLINAAAVIFEKYFVKLLIKHGEFYKFVVFFNEDRFTKFINKRMFLFLFVSAFSFIPFEPFRFIAIIEEYDDKKYFLSTFLGRGLRYGMLAIIGNEMLKYNWLTAVVLISLVVFFFQKYRLYKKNKGIPFKSKSNIKKY